MMSFSFGLIKKIALWSLFVLTLTQSLSAAQASEESYTVAKGDTLYSISRKYGVEVSALKSKNNIGSNNVIVVGQKLIIPGNPDVAAEQSGKNAVKSSSAVRKFDTYTVQKGDTFYNIAKVNAVSIAELKRLNNISDESLLRVGQKLNIPVSHVDTDSIELPDLPSSDPRKYSSKKGDPTLTWPVYRPEVTYTRGKVSGVHLTAALNESVKCIRAGIVMYTGNYRGYGQVVFVQAKAGYIYAYTGLGSISVHKGDYVVFSDKLGEAGKDSIKGSSQISLMVFLNSKPIDPAKAPRG